MMRRLVDIAIVTGLAVLGAGAYLVVNRDAEEDRLRRELAAETMRFQNEVHLRAASGVRTALNPRGWPTTVDPSWFGPSPPRNRMLPPGHPWVEVAPPEHAKLTDPPMRLAADGSLASFWYNPYRGLVRARVPMMINDEASIALYNEVNRASIAALYDPPSIDTPPAPEPEPAPTTAAAPAPAPTPPPAPGAMVNESPLTSAPSAEPAESSPR